MPRASNTTGGSGQVAPRTLAFAAGCALSRYALLAPESRAHSDTEPGTAIAQYAFLSCGQIAPYVVTQATRPHSRAPIQTLGPAALVSLYRSFRLRRMERYKNTSAGVRFL